MGLGAEPPAAWLGIVATLAAVANRVVVPATAEAGAGFSGDDLVWLLEKAPAEVLILRPDPEDRRFVTANGSRAAA